MIFVPFELEEVEFGKIIPGIPLPEKSQPECGLSHISSKILRNIGVIKRFRTFLPKETLDSLQKTFVEPHFRYCNIVWERCNKTQLNKLQQLQNRAARAVAKVRFKNTNHAKL